MTLLLTLLLAPATVADPAHEAAGANGGLPQMDVSTFPSQLFWLAITFGILFWCMRASILPRLGGIIEERNDRIADDLDQAADFRKEAEEAQHAYEEALSDARAKAQGIAGDTRKAIDEEIAGLQASMEEELAQKIGDAEARIADMTANAQAKVREAAVETTKAVVEVLIDEAPTKEAIEAAIARVS